MYSVLVLGFAMLARGYGIHVPEWVSPAATFLIVGYFLFLSWKQIRIGKKEGAPSYADSYQASMNGLLHNRQPN